MSVPSPAEVQDSITALLAASRAGEGPTTQEMADRLGLPEPVIASVIDWMHAHGVVKYTPVRPATVRWRLR